MNGSSIMELLSFCEGRYRDSFSSFGCHLNKDILRHCVAYVDHDLSSQAITENCFDMPSILAQNLGRTFDSLTCQRINLAGWVFKFRPIQLDEGFQVPGKVHLYFNDIYSLRLLLYAVNPMLLDISTSKFKIQMKSIHHQGYNQKTLDEIACLIRGAGL